ncbi:MAG: hypothetical protein AB1656_00345 [Candidatus Omnitrophota bacterium]
MIVSLRRSAIVMTALCGADCSFPTALITWFVAIVILNLTAAWGIAKTMVK